MIKVIITFVLISLIMILYLTFAIDLISNFKQNFEPVGGTHYEYFGKF